VTSDRQAESHVGLLVSGAIFVWVAVRALVAGGFNPTVALAVLAESDVLQVGLGLLVSTYSLILVGLFVAAAIWFASIEKNRYSEIAIAIMASLVVFVAEWTVVVAALGMAALGIVLASWRNRARQRKGFGKVPFIEPEAVAFFLVLAFFFTPPMWLPPEVITTSAGTEVGYVLNIDNEWASVLVVHEPEVIRLKASDITDREICQHRSPAGSLLSLMFGETTATSDCPEPP
jgi:hypothetical protein